MKLLYFASVRERVGTGEETIAAAEAPADLASLRERLVARGAGWREGLSQANLLCAVNQTVVHGNVELKASDEIAFYPPVTGG